ncbi:uncharacterized protein LY89DRAFT_361739 [Mollisia scopiformis]|uniref:Uncharacterized protein n=1 Tax=Mollisia scopiformis TaxID=149040 RepID=A0A132B4E5_MOLSC|nr:uncharacterized protein LY89DRAFT_361739 [Mollisia scopiformis]KUJ07288.1 hypothetical protein LY89DRAFT_361739 [Mollisia scopiformis]
MSSSYSSCILCQMSRPASNDWTYWLPRPIVPYQACIELTRTIAVPVFLLRVLSRASIEYQLRQRATTKTTPPRHITMNPRGHVLIHILHLKSVRLRSSPFFHTDHRSTEHFSPSLTESHKPNKPQVSTTHETLFPSRVPSVLPSKHLQAPHLLPHKNHPHTLNSANVQIPLNPSNHGPWNHPENLRDDLTDRHRLSKALCK